MGMFDDIVCRYALPVEGLRISSGFVYQTKDTPAQFLDAYEIREDGTLWHEDYDVEDRSKASVWKRENPGKKLPKHLRGIDGMVGCMSRTNKRWVRLNIFTGEIRFYSPYSINSSGRATNDIGVDGQSGWIEFSAYFYNGLLKEIGLVEHIPFKYKVKNQIKKRKK